MLGHLEQSLVALTLTCSRYQIRWDSHSITLTQTSPGKPAPAAAACPSCFGTDYPLPSQQQLSSGQPSAFQESAPHPILSASPSNIPSTSKLRCPLFISPLTIPFGVVSFCPPCLYVRLDTKPQLFVFMGMKLRGTGLIPGTSDGMFLAF